MDTDNYREQERRRVSSVVVGEELLGTIPEEQVRYVEVPYVEEVIKHVAKKEIREIEKRVPKYEYEWVEKIVEVPQIQYVDKVVEIPQIQEIVKHIPKKEIIDVPKEIVKHVPRIETRVVEKVIEVPGEVIEVPKPYKVENRVTVPQYVDREVPIVVAQTLRPVLTESDEVLDVDVIEYEPHVIPVDIQVPKPIQSQLTCFGVTEESHRVVSVPAAQYNSMLKLLNPHIADDVNALPYITEGNQIPLLPATERVAQVAPMSNANIIGWQKQRTAVREESHSIIDRTRGGDSRYNWTQGSKAGTLREPIIGHRGFDEESEILKTKKTRDTRGNRTRVTSRPDVRPTKQAGCKPC